MLVLGLETSCDETGAAVVRDGKTILSDVLASSADLFSPYGGIVPEIASRRQIATIIPVLKKALARAGTKLSDIDGIAVTRGPGLIGSLLVGLNTAKSIAFSRRIPYVGVSHLDSHLWAIFLEEPGMTLPFLALLASGGHTALYQVHGPGRTSAIGATRDDAAGEAFDKVAMALGLGYPGGPLIDSLAGGGDPGAVKFPRAKIRGGGMDFSFSGIKTAAAQLVKERKESRRGRLSGTEIADICAGFQEAVVDMLVERTFQASRHLGLKDIVLCGGVAANSRLRARIRERARSEGATVHIPSPALCTDNGAMVACLGYHYLAAGRSDGPDLDAYAT